MREKILAFFPELMWISDETLRTKCIGAWISGLVKGGWSAESLEEIPFVLDELKDCPVLLSDHVKNVTKTAAMLCDTMSDAYPFCEKPDRDIVVAGAILHDVGKLMEYAKTPDGYSYSRYGKYIRHPAAGIILAAENGIPEEILHIIAGALIDTVAAIIILAPILVPIGLQLGVGELHLGVLFVVNLVIGYVTPPFGYNLFTASSVSKEPFAGVVKGVLPFLLIEMACVLLITFVPEIITWIPDLLQQ